MNGRKVSQIIVIQLIALFQGLAYGVVPSIVDLVTDPDFHNIPAEHFRVLFIPFIVAAVLLAAAAGWASQRRKIRTIFISGMTANFTALALTAATNFTLPIPSLSFIFLFAAHFFLGGGVGMALTVLNRWVFVLFPKNTFSAVLFLWGAAGFGILISGLLIDYVLLLHKWWLGPMLVLGALFILLLISELLMEYPEMPREQEGKINASILVFLIPSILYGYLMSNLGKWHYDLMVQNQEFLFFGFWAVSVVSRFLIGILFPFLRPIYWYCFLPLLIILAPLILPFSQFVTAFALAALFPINLVWVQKQFPGKESLAAGLGIACYLSGIAIGIPLMKGAVITVAGGGILFFFHLFAGIAFPINPDRKNS